MTLSIIIVNFNTPSELMVSLRSIKRNLKDMKYEVLVVDNCSSDRSVETLVSKFPWANFFFMTENLGYARANNFAAAKSIGEFILFLNPDTELIEDCVSEILEFIYHNEKVGACAPMLLYKDSTYQNSCGSRMGLIYESAEALMLISIYRKIWKWMKIDRRFSSDPIEVGWVSGAFMLLKKRIFLEARQFSSKYFLNYEDIDVCLRIEKLGYSNYYFPDLKCVHLDQTSQKRDYSAFVYNRYLSRLIFSKAHYGLLRRILVRIIHIFGILMRLIFTKLIYKGKEKSERYAGYKKSLKLYIGLKI